MFGCTKNPNKKIESMASLLILGGVIPLAGALMVQYGLHKAPCHFCMLQRYPYIPVIIFGIMSLLVKRAGLAWRLCVALGICGLLATGTLGLIHTGIEQGWLNYTGGCVATAPADGSIEALRNAIMSAPLVACNEVAAAFMGLSMATWNTIWTIIIITLMGLQYRYDIKHHSA